MLLRFLGRILGPASAVGRVRQISVLSLSGILILAGAIANGFTLDLGTQSASAWNCGQDDNYEDYHFLTSRTGEVDAINDSDRDEPAQGANVFINGAKSQNSPLSVPALKAGESANIGTVATPGDAGFTWLVSGTKDCKSTGVYAEIPPPPELRVEWKTTAVCDVEPNEVEIRGKNVNSVSILITGELFALPDGGSEVRISAVPPQFQEVPPGGFGGPEERIENHFDFFSGVVYGWAEAHTLDGQFISGFELPPTRLLCGEEPPPPEVEIELTCQGVRVFGRVPVDPILEVTLSDGQVLHETVQGEFSFFIPWDPPIDGTFGPHEVWAEAVLKTESGTVLDSEREEATLTCAEASYSLTLSGNCNSGLATGHADTSALLEITGTGADGEPVSVSQEVGPGDFSVPIDWENPGTFGPHTISLSGTLTAGEEVVADDSFEAHVNCGEPPPPPPVVGCSDVSAKIVMIRGKMTVTGTGGGDGVRWEVVRRSDGEVMDSGNGDSARFKFVGAYKERYVLVFIGENGERSGGCSFEPSVQCAKCEPAYWETIPAGGVALKFYSVGECTVCKETNTLHLEVWARLEGYVYFEVFYKGELLKAEKDEEETMAGDVWRLEFRFTWLEDRQDFSVWADYENGVRIRDVAEFVKYTVCSDAPGLDDISTNGIATFQPGQQKSDWAVLLQQMGVVDDYQEGLDWAFQLVDAGSLALPEMPST